MTPEDWWREDQGPPCRCGHTDLHHDPDDGCGGCAMHLHVGRCREYAALPEPPAWEEQEWCDGGYTCEHWQCIGDLHERQADMLHDAQ